MFALMESHHDSEYACARDSIRLVIRPEEGRSPSETGSRVYEGKPRGKKPHTLATCTRNDLERQYRLETLK